MPSQTDIAEQWKLTVMRFNEWLLMELFTWRWWTLAAATVQFQRRRCSTSATRGVQRRRHIQIIRIYKSYASCLANHNYEGYAVGAACVCDSERGVVGTGSIKNESGCIVSRIVRSTVPIEIAGQ